MTYATKHRRPAPNIEAEITPVPEEGRLVPFQEEAVTAEPIEASWDRARALWAEATRGADAIIQLGYVLQKLKLEFFGVRQGKRTDLAASSTPGGDSGWQKTVQEQLGISKQTALRLIEKADTLDRLTALANGEDIQWKDSSGEIKITAATSEAKTLAQQVIPDVVAGLMNPRRAWAGVCGEAARSEITKQRAPLDRVRVMLRAIKSLQTWVGQVGDAEVEDQFLLLKEWGKLCDILPDQWVTRAAKKASSK